MKILMLTTQLGYGGAETSFIRLANFLAESMDVTVALFTGSGTYDAGHETLNAPMLLLDEGNVGRITRWFRRIRKLRALKAQHDATISFLSGPNLVNVLASRNASSIVSLRGSRVYDPVAPTSQKLLFQYIIDPIIFRLAARIVPVSQGIINEVRAVAGRSAVAKTHIISPFIDSSALAARMAEPVPNGYADLQNKKVIVAVGRLSVEKGFHHLIRVFATMKMPDATLLLVGNGPMEAELRNQCARLGITDSVRFAGYQKNVLPFMKLGTVYAMTSATEGFPNVVLEAMAAGLPVIASDTPWGSRSILSNQPAVQEPYPTQQPTQADYGTLMPRIDDVRYEAMWVEALRTALHTPHKAHPERVNDFDLAKVGENWKKLLHELS